MISVHKNAIRPINAQVSSIFTRHQKWVFAYKKRPIQSILIRIQKPLFFGINATPKSACIAIKTFSSYGLLINKLFWRILGYHQKILRRKKIHSSASKKAL